MRVVAYTKYDRESAATRQRFLQYAPYLAAAGIAFESRPLLDQGYVRSLTTGERWPRSLVVRNYGERLMQLLRRPDADLVWVYGELFPYLPAVFEKLVRRTAAPVVIDWDDANFIKYNDSSNGLVRAFLSGKLERLLAAAAAATCGNSFLRDYAARYCPDSRLFPTVVDTEVYRSDPSRGERSGGPLTIGWIGSPSTWKNVRPILPLLADLCAGGKIRFRVVGAGIGAASDRFAGMELVDWSEAGEVAEVQGFDIGIMPLIDAPFERGKCAYKLIQYMGCAVASVASPVGANCDVVVGETGLLATSAGEWSEALGRLIADPELRRDMGAAGRARVIDHYSLQAYAPRLVELFRNLARPADQAGGRAAKNAT
jgi:glycosyltransferase involved in cell wall biosynthesis